MLLFLQQLVYYVTLEVIDRHWRTFTEKQATVRSSLCASATRLTLGVQASTVDYLLALHTDFLDSCLKGCMLTDPRLVKVRATRGQPLSNRRVIDTHTAPRRVSAVLRTQRA